MVRPTTNHVLETFPTIPLAIGLFVSVILIVALCAKHARQIPSEPNTPKPLITTISHKAMMHLIPAARKSNTGIVDGNNDGRGLWQKEIMMGERCRPPQFSGVIYYDCSGNRVPEMPRSPRATLMSPLRNFAFPPLENMDKSASSSKQLLSSQEIRGIATHRG